MALTQGFNAQLHSDSLLGFSDEILGSVAVTREIRLDDATYFPDFGNFRELSGNTSDSNLGNYVPSKVHYHHR